MVKKFYFSITTKLFGIVVVVVVHSHRKTPRLSVLSTTKTEKPQPGSCRSELGGVAVSGDKTLGTSWHLTNQAGK